MKLILNKQLIILHFFLNFYELFCIKLNKIKLRDPVSLFKRNSFNENKINQPKYKWTEEWLDNVPIDHFSFKDIRTFKLRYLINTDYFKQKNAPIFFCLGDDDAVDDSPDFFGFMLETASEFGAAIIFAEHRFAGKSLPFGNNSYTNISNLGYFSPDQAIVDYVLLIKYLKEKRLVNAKNSPVIAFGASYSGGLTAYMRLKYPQVTVGGIASSAIVTYFLNVPTTPQSSYYDIIMRTYLYYGCTMQMLNKSFDAILQLANTSEGRVFLNKNYHLSPLSQINTPYDAQQLIDIFKFTMEFSSKFNFNINHYSPYPSFPARLSCQAFTTAKTFEEVALAPYYSINMYYNSTGELETFQFWNFTDNNNNNTNNKFSTWDWLSCTKLINPICARGPPYDIFNKSCPFNINDDLINRCMPLFSNIGYTKDYYQPYWIVDNYGYDFKTATNIVFINGFFDILSGGGWKQTTTHIGSVYSYITDGGHTYDIHASYPDDTNLINYIRFKEKMHIAEWIHQAKSNFNTTD